MLFHREKQAFFDCLNENGFHVIYDLDKLAEVLPDRSANEIQYETVIIYMFI